MSKEKLIGLMLHFLFNAGKKNDCLEKLLCFVLLLMIFKFKNKLVVTSFLQFITVDNKLALNRLKCTNKINLTLFSLSGLVI